MTVSDSNPSASNAEDLDVTGEPVLRHELRGICVIGLYLENADALDRATLEDLQKTVDGHVFHCVAQSDERVFNLWLSGVWQVLPSPEASDTPSDSPDSPTSPSADPAPDLPAGSDA